VIIDAADNKKGPAPPVYFELKYIGKESLLLPDKAIEQTQSTHL
jgi:hypothetical protein